MIQIWYQVSFLGLLTTKTKVHEKSVGRPSDKKFPQVHIMKFVPDRST